MPANTSIKVQENINFLIDEFLEYYISLNASKNTLNNYAVDLKQFEKWCNTQSFTEFSDITIKDIENFLKSLGNVAPTTIQRKISSVRMFFQYLQREEIITSNVAKTVKLPHKPQKQPDIITKDEALRIVQASENESVANKNINTLGNLLIIKLLLNLGLRRAELIEITLKDIDLNQGRILIQGKGNKQRYVFLNPELKKSIIEYLAISEIAKKTPNDKLFPLHVATINNIVNHAMEIANCKKKGRSCHALRKRFASSAYSATLDIYVIASALGHSDLHTIKTYAEVDEKQTRNAFNSVNF